MKIYKIGILGMTLWLLGCTSSTAYQRPSYYDVHKIPEQAEVGVVHQVDDLRNFEKPKTRVAKTFQGMALRDYPKPSYFE